MVTVHQKVPVMVTGRYLAEYLMRVAIVDRQPALGNDPSDDRENYIVLNCVDDKCCERKYEQVIKNCAIGRPMDGCIRKNSIAPTNKILQTHYGLCMVRV